ncbi:hypothetical protein ACJJVG_08785 [Pseudocitrobacter faecalis]|uniref:hypothetical protein n=1 Tax=Pseudocitrobacter faecalis TaxID=1398493 RepID=UPI0038999BEE
MNEFNKIYNDLGLDRAVLSILMGVNRSTLIKWIDDQDGRTTPLQQPSAAAFTLIKVLQFMKHRNPEMFAEFMVLQDFNVPGEVYLNNPEYWRGWEWAQHKLNKGVQQYLLENIKPEQESKL